MMKLALRPADLSPKCTPVHRLLYPLLEPIFFSTSQKLGRFNKTNAYRWYRICVESLEKGEHDRMRNGLFFLQKIAADKKARNREEAIDYLGRLSAGQKQKSYAANMLEQEATQKLGSAIGADSEMSKAGFRAVIQGKLDMLPSKRPVDIILFLTLTLYENFNRAEKPEGKGVRFVESCEAVRELLKEHYERDAPGIMAGSPNASVLLSLRNAERAIQEGLEDCYHELILEFPDIINIKFGTTEMLGDSCELILYGEVSDAEYKRYILNKMNKK